MIIRHILITLLLTMFVTPATSTEQMPYTPAKVVYDVSSPDAIVLNNILDRASMLQNIYGNNPFEASIIIIVHEGAIPLFATSNQSEQNDLMRRAQSLTMGEIIQFRLCSASARMRGFTKEDFYEFVAMVPMADAEIIQLQNEGYAYLR